MVLLCSNAADRLFRYPNGSLSVNGVRDQDEGVYQCVADNEAGSDRFNVTLTILGKYVVCVACNG